MSGRAGAGRAAGTTQLLHVSLRVESSVRGGAEDREGTLPTCGNRVSIFRVSCFDIWGLLTLEAAPPYFPDVQANPEPTACLSSVPLTLGASPLPNHEGPGPDSEGQQPLCLSPWKLSDLRVLSLSVRGHGGRGSGPRFPPPRLLTEGLPLRPPERGVRPSLNY